MRKKIIAGNWKMNKTLPEAILLVNEICQELKARPELINNKDFEIVLAPPFVYLNECYKLIHEFPNVFVASQNCYPEESGAFTGEVSVNMIKSVGAKYIIIGHSERRSYFKEDYLFLARKVLAALKHDMKPIFCIGEVLNEREASQHFEVIRTQLQESLFQLNVVDFEQIIIAYEPVWAIGTGKTASPQQAQEMHAYIRSLIAEKYGDATSQHISLLYGGSCNAQNARELFSMPDVDGGLIGGASLKAQDFITIIESLI